MSEPLQFPAFPKPAVRVILWEGKERPVEASIRDLLTADGFGVVRWDQEPTTGWGPHTHIYPETIWELAGSLTVLLPAESRMIELMPGDRIEIPQGVVHGTFAGADGAVFLLATR